MPCRSHVSTFGSVRTARTQRATHRIRGVTTIHWLDGPTEATYAIAEESLRRCTSCGQWKPSSAFHNSRTDQFSYCRECRNAYDRRYYAEHGRDARLERKRAHRRDRQAWLNSLEDGVPCADCGQMFPAPLMHWDHLPGYLKIDEVSNLAASRSLCARIATRFAPPLGRDVGDNRQVTGCSSAW